MRARAIEPRDNAAWLRMRAALWPDADGEHETMVARYFTGARHPMLASAFVVEDAEGRVRGFAEASVRPWAEGCVTARVAYLEGWYVEPDARGRGVGRELVRAVEAWGRAQGCTEFASDADPENDVSHAAHLALGFEDVGLVRCFRKDLPGADHPAPE